MHVGNKTAGFLSQQVLTVSSQLVLQRTQWLRYEVIIEGYYTVRTIGRHSWISNWARQQPTNQLHCKVSEVHPIRGDPSWLLNQSQAIILSFLQLPVVISGWNLAGYLPNMSCNYLLYFSSKTVLSDATIQITLQQPHICNLSYKQCVIHKMLCLLITLKHFLGYINTQTLQYKHHV